MTEPSVEKPDKQKKGSTPAGLFEGVRPERTPSAMQAFGLMFGFSLRRAVRGKVLYAAMGLLALPALLLVFLRLADVTIGQKDWTSVVRWWLSGVLPLSAILVGYGAVADEVEAKTLSYLFLRPLPRWSLPLGKAAVGVSFVGAGAILLVVVGSALAGQDAPGAQVLFSCALAAFFYVSAAVLAGALFPKHGVVASLAFFGTMDLAVGAVPGFTSAASPGFHIQNIAGVLPPPGKIEIILKRPDISITASTTVILILTAVILICAVVRVSAREYKAAP